MYIRELGSGKYRVEVSDRTDYTGKRKRVSKVFKATSKRDLNRQIKEWLEGETATGNLEELIASVWSNVVQGKSPTTIEGYRVIRERIEKTLGKCKIPDLTPRTVQEWINELDNAETESKNGKEKKKKYSAKTIKNTYSLMRRICTVAVSWELIKSNPCHDIILPTNKKKEADVLSADEFRIFVDHLDELDLDTKVLFELALFGSLRRGEIMAIKENDIPSNGKFFVSNARYVVKGQEYLKATKTASGERMVYLPMSVMSDIERLRREHIEKKLRFGKIWNDSPFLIKNELGEALHPNRANDRLRSYMERIGLKPITFHQLRHTYASICISFGYSVEEVSKRMGHSNPSVTLSIYTHLFKNEDEIADGIATKFDELLTNQK